MVAFVEKCQKVSPKNQRNITASLCTDAAASDEEHCTIVFQAFQGPAEPIEEYYNYLFIDSNIVIFVLYFNINWFLLTRGRSFVIAWHLYLLIGQTVQDL